MGLRCLLSWQCSLCHAAAAQICCSTSCAPSSTLLRSWNFLIVVSLHLRLPLQASAWSSWATLAGSAAMDSALALWAESPGLIGWVCCRQHELEQQCSEVMQTNEQLLALQEAHAHTADADCRGQLADLVGK